MKILASELNYIQFEDRTVDSAEVLLDYQRGFIRNLARKNINPKVLKENIEMAINKYYISLN